MGVAKTFATPISYERVNIIITISEIKKF